MPLHRGRIQECTTTTTDSMPAYFGIMSVSFFVGTSIWKLMEGNTVEKNCVWNYQMANKRGNPDGKKLAKNWKNPSPIYLWHKVCSLSVSKLYCHSVP